VARVYSTLLFSGAAPFPGPDSLGGPGAGTLWVIRTIILVPPLDSFGSSYLGIQLALSEGGGIIAQYVAPETVSNIPKTINMRTVVPYGVEVMCNTYEYVWNVTMSGYTLTTP